MFINCLWFIEQAWETLYNKPFIMKICEVIWIFTNYLWKTGSWKRDVSFFAEFMTLSMFEHYFNIVGYMVSRQYGNGYVRKWNVHWISLMCRYITWLRLGKILSISAMCCKIHFHLWLYWIIASYKYHRCTSHTHTPPTQTHAISSHLIFFNQRCLRLWSCYW